MPPRRQDSPALRVLLELDAVRLTTTRAAAVLFYVCEHPGTTYRDLKAAMPDCSLTSIRRAVEQLWDRGFAERTRPVRGEKDDTHDLRTILVIPTDKGIRVARRLTKLMAG